MNDRNVQRWTGAFGVASIALILLSQPLYFVGGTAPRLQNTVKLSEYVTRNNAIILSRRLATRSLSPASWCSWSVCVT